LSPETFPDGHSELWTSCTASTAARTLAGVQNMKTGKEGEGSGYEEVKRKREGEGKGRLH